MRGMAPRIFHTRHEARPQEQIEYPCIGLGGTVKELGMPLFYLPFILFVGSMSALFDCLPAVPAKASRDGED
jgi:hypothetical protein